MNTEKMQKCLEGLKSTSNKLSMLYSTLSDEGRKNTAQIIASAINDINDAAEFLSSLSGDTTAESEEIAFDDIGSNTNISYTF